MELDIDILIKSCIQNDRKSQKQFYMLTSDRLMNVSRRYTTDINDAKDVLQNAYINIFKNLSKFDLKKGELDGWMTRIVINEALQLYRKNRQNALKEQLNQELFVTKTAPDILSRLNAEDMLKILRKLPDGYRIIFNMSVVEGFSHKEISSQLGISESTSRSQLTRAKKMLRVIFEQMKITELC